MITPADVLKGSVKITKIKLGYKIPLKVIYYISYRCNLRCCYCERRLAKSQELSTDQVKKIMRDFKKLGTLSWSFNGGEALLRDDIGELVAYAKKMGFKCNLVSNAWIIAEKIKVVEQVDSIVISLDGPKEIHDAVRGKGSYDKAVNALKLLKNKKPVVIVNTVLNNTNIDSLEDILEVVDEYGCGWEIQPVFCHSKSEKDKAIKYFASHEDIREVVKWLVQQKKKGKKIHRSNEVLEFIKEKDHSVLPDCYAGRAFVILSPDGRILPCAQFLSESSRFPSCLSQGVKEAFSQLPDMSKCRLCSFCCYLEYNFALHSVVKTGIRYVKNKSLGK